MGTSDCRTKKEVTVIRTNKFIKILKIKICKMEKRIELKKMKL